MNEDTSRNARTLFDNGQPSIPTADYKHPTKTGFSSTPPNKGTRGSTAVRSEGVITWHAQAHLDLFSEPVINDHPSTPLKPATIVNRDDQFFSRNLNNQPKTINHNLQKPIGERDGREVLSPTPPKANREDNIDSWQQSTNARARHRRAHTRSTGSTPDVVPPPSTNIATTNNSNSLNSITTPPKSRSKSVQNIDIHAAHAVLPPLSWKRTPQTISPSGSDTSSDVSDLDTSLVASTSFTKLPQVQLAPIWAEPDTNNEPQEPARVSPTPLDESTALVFTVIRQHHSKIEETLNNRLSLLRNANLLISKNGGWPNGIPFALEYILTHGDVASLVDLAKVAYSISEDGGDDGDVREEMDASDYEWMAAWLSAVPVMIKASNPSHVLVGLKVLSIVIPILEQWVETAIGIAHSLGPDAIPDELREQCHKYNENCQKLLPVVDGLERKGRIGVVTNEVYLLLQAFLDKTLP